jgi:hypothetical protein
MSSQFNAVEFAVILREKVALKFSACRSTTLAVTIQVTASVVDRQAENFKATFSLNMTANSTALNWEDIPEFMDYKENVAICVALAILTYIIHFPLSLM